MLPLVMWIVALLAAPMFVVTAFLSVELLAALLPARRRSAGSESRPRCAVLVPAHNEACGIGRTLLTIQQQLVAGDRILVVADNCTDNTALVARSAGAEVVERTDPGRRGKGYALDFGVRMLEADPPEVVVIVDADCVVEKGSLDSLVRMAAMTGRPAQATYLMEAPPSGGTRAQIAAFLFALKNAVRPSGLARIGLPCLLTGSGMAFPWPVLRLVPLASGNIVEDMQLGIDLAIAGHAPRFCRDATIRSDLPAGAGAVSQRTRWIHGHLRTLLVQVPRLVAAALGQRRPELLGLALELAVPPLSLLALAEILMLTPLLAGWLLGGPGLPAAIATSAAGIFAASLLLAWLRLGREYLPLAGLLAIPVEFAARLAILLRFLVRPQTTWVRTLRRAPD